MPDYLLYTPSVETVEPDEVETQEKIIQLMRDGSANVRAKDGRSERISHAKAYGVLASSLSPAPTMCWCGLPMRPEK